MKKVTKEDLYNGLEVYDCEGVKGRVIDCDDIHNVTIESDEREFSGFWCNVCFDENCEEGRKDMSEIPFYIKED